MKKLVIMIGFVLGLTGLLLACTNRTEQSQVPSPVPTITILPFFITETPRVTATLTPSNTPTPSDTPTATITPTPITPTLTPSLTPTPPVVAAIFSQRNVNLREAPSGDSAVLTDLEPGTEVEVHWLSENKRWVFVRVFVEGEGTLEGWIAEELLDLGTYIPPTQGPTATITPTGIAPVVTTSPTILGATLSGTASTPAPFVTITPSGSTTANPSTSATPATTPSKDLSQHNVLAYCLEEEQTPPTIQADDTVSIYWWWYVARPELMDDHLANAQYEVLLDGRLLTNYENYAMPLAREPRDGNWYVYWYVPVGTLPPGRHEVTYRLTWAEAVNDGYESFGPGTATEFNEGKCVFTVSP